jgi:hypothetical protein
MQVEFDPNGRSKWFKSWGDEQHFMILHDFDTPSIVQRKALQFI